ncbi:phenylalanine--tRNA ligase subunit beta [Candidatus Shapirobacteria bacterium CG09_land_8_20_14_0_10_38_17]|uniref:Phenylalanine--tRNA ligase beta subunit n=1 Tax=Candidatus Shapirobacteria bacterium CG09_land_8_20_14_0_10_38_17 TaxID=1974884 RepID=A0A2H0WRW5_9BACT|nr:MAG: phenylalanine--tRNA ligase subunit beta [Candidatus Shapirobacteria bacterium CG09_land_8_20_14_0_10_38_17]
MNILIPVSWLREFIKTKATTPQIANYLSLCSQSVERVHRWKNDSVLEIEITSNRPDCLSVIGLARELNAILPRFGFSTKLTLPKKQKITLPSRKCPLKIKINPPSICPRFTAILIENVKIGPSPKLIQERLYKIGLRPLNNVIDVSNYLMFETGQPIHTFDYDKIAGQTMIMRLSQKGEKVITLDGVERTMPGGDIVIEDGAGRLIDLCGIMGAKNSAIDRNTRRVLFFVQSYNPQLIRRTSILLGHRTEAAVRFERGIDLENILPVVLRGAKMIEKLSGGKITSSMIDLYHQKQKSTKVSLSFGFVQKIIGEKIEHQLMIEILTNLGFKLLKKDSRQAQFLVPTWRIHDVGIEEDLIEEIARLYGYFNLKSQIPPLPPIIDLRMQKKTTKGKFSPLFYWRERAKDYLRYQGFWETYSYSFISKKLINKAQINKEEHLVLKNPLSQDLKFMRRSLIPSLLDILSQNQAQFPQEKIFEIANIYLPRKKNLPYENLCLTGLVTTKNFSKTKGIIEGLLQDLGIINYQFIPQGPTTAKIYVNKKHIGQLGLVKSAILDNFKIEKDVISFTLDIDQISQLATKQKIYAPLSKYPPVVEDLTLIFSPKTYLGPVIHSIESISPLIKNAQIIDSFDCSRTFRLTYQNPRRSLTLAEIKEIREKIVKEIKEKFGAKVRQ